MSRAAPRRRLAKAFRRTMSRAEVQLWTLLRSRRLDGYKFRRQVPLGRYVADFACLKHRLIVEADGPFHGRDHDARRDAWLAEIGFRVLRFRNEEIELWPELVIDKVRDALVPGSALHRPRWDWAQPLPPHPAAPRPPSPTRGEGE